MPTRRIALTACALCLAVARVAGAQPIHDQLPGHTDHVARGAWLDKQTPGDTYSQLHRAEAVDDEGRQQGASDNAGTTGQVDRIGSLTAEQLAAAYGTTKPAAATHASADDGTNGWRIAAVTEAALLAALALAAALIVRARHRASSMGM